MCVRVCVKMDLLFLSEEEDQDIGHVEDHSVDCGSHPGEKEEEGEDQ